MHIASKHNKARSKKVPSKNAASKKDTATKPASNRKVTGTRLPKPPELPEPVQAFNDLQAAWGRNVLEGARCIAQIQAEGGADPSADRAELTNLAAHFGLIAAQADSLVEWHRAIIKAIKASPDAAGLADALASHKDEIALKRTSARNSRGCEKKLLKLLAKAGR